VNYYETNFALIHHHKWNPEYLDNVMPWEKEIYTNLLIKHLEEEAKRYKERQQKGR